MRKKAIFFLIDKTHFYVKNAVVDPRDFRTKPIKLNFVWNLVRVAPESKNYYRSIF